MRGHIRKRAKGSWTIVLDYGTDSDTGKRRQHWSTIRGTKKEADKKLSELLHQIDIGNFVKPTKITFGEYLKQWLTDYVHTNVRAATAEGYRIIIERHVIPSLGMIILSQLSSSHIQRYYAGAIADGRRDKKGGLSARTVMHHHRLIREVLSHAMKRGLLARNVADAVDPPRPVPKEMKALDTEGVQQLLLGAKGTKYFPLIHLAIFSGMRRSELLGLRWKDMDLIKGTVSISQVLHCLPGGLIVFEQPKTAKSKRLVSLSSDAVLALRAHQETEEANLALADSSLEKDRLVFSQIDGSPFLPNTVTHAFGKISKRVGFDGIHFHSLRHTHASIMLQQGVSPKTVADRLGHSTVTITLDTYSHVTPGIKEEAANLFEDALRNTESVPGRLTG